MNRRAAPIALAALLLASACEQAEDAEAPPAAAASEAAGAAPLPEPGEANLPLQASDFPELQSRDCATIAQFYADAIAVGEFERAALVWNDPVIDGARLRALFAGYAAPRIAPGDVALEGAAGSSYCTVPGVLTDTADPAKAPAEGQLVLRRVNDVPGATPDQLRWTLQSSTFVESMERSGRG